MSLTRLDEALQRVAVAMADAFRDEPWQVLRYAARWTPAGDVGADDFWLTTHEERRVLPDLAASLKVSDAAKAHWRLTKELGQPAWYCMTVTLERSGKYGADFEYSDDYLEGDIIRRAQSADG